jgi:antitoxin ParD1/3/4
MSKNTSITLGDHYESFVSEQIKEGHYGSVSETIRAGLRLLEEREVKLKALRKALQEGEESERVSYPLTQLLAELDAEEEQ